MEDCIMVIGWIVSMIGILCVMGCVAIIWDVFDRMKEYDRMKERGFTPFRDDEWWVGYGD